MSALLSYWSDINVQSLWRHTIVVLLLYYHINSDHLIVASQECLLRHFSVSEDVLGLMQSFGCCNPILVLALIYCQEC